VTHFLITWGPATLWAGVLFLLSAQSDLSRLSVIPLGDKIGHIVLFSVLGVALAWGSRNTRDIRLHAGLFLLGALFAATDEWHQAFVPSRQPSAGDFLADMVGITIGYVMARALVGSLKTRKTRDL
jgi:VanZ family protein